MQIIAFKSPFNFLNLQKFAMFHRILHLVFTASYLGVQAQQAAHFPPSGAFDDGSGRMYFSGQMAFSLATFRDFATSPLFYNGPGLSVSTNALYRSGRTDERLELSFGIFSTFASVPNSDVLQSGGFSVFNTINLYYHHLFFIRKISNDQFRIKVGPAFNSTQNIRVNQGLFNNALGLENIANLMIAASLVRDFSRLKDKKLNFYLFKFMLPARRRELHVQINSGILNFNYRPGYAYAYDGEIIGTETSPLNWALQNYRWNMNGWRLQTRLEWLWYLYNGNAFSLFYHWDAAHAPGQFEAFQMAVHRMGFSYYFERKIKQL
ncbi:hypothetical protein [Schleiferia thermophila]|jgi:hypothetical protein|nr:hypothetical protein [Schleiferia thermophila]GCD80751.1 hypothetical protein JCM30197_19980 [Schleiferia thermophila]